MTFKLNLVPQTTARASVYIPYWFSMQLGFVWIIIIIKLLIIINTLTLTHQYVLFIFIDY